MDNAMVKRGIGAVVLAVIAAVLLAFLLKGKSRERQDVVEMKLPGAPEMNIPSLTGASDATATLIESGKATIEGATTGAGDKIKGAGSAIIASATGAAANITDSTANTPTLEQDSTSATIQKSDPGFAIRPSSQNEQKEITDNTNATATAAPTIKETAKMAKGTVVASAATATKKVKKAFKPEIIEKKKVVKKAVKKTEKKEKPVANNAPASSKPLGKYSVQLLATSSQSRASKLAKTMKSEGYKVFVTQTTRENKILYRVRVGGHNNRNGAIKAQEGMKKRYQKNFFVQNSLVVSN